eukprot:15458026-Alexandrium_andersonii.AAC.1
MPALGPVSRPTPFSLHGSVQVNAGRRRVGWHRCELECPTPKASLKARGRAIAVMPTGPRAE